MTEKGIEVVMNALAGTPTVVTADFANEVEQILREKIQIEIEQNRCAMACQGCGIAIFCFL